MVGFRVYKTDVPRNPLPDRVKEPLTELNKAEGDDGQYTVRIAGTDIYEIVYTAPYSRFGPNGNREQSPREVTHGFIDRFGNIASAETSGEDFKALLKLKYPQIETALNNYPTLQSLEIHSNQIWVSNGSETGYIDLQTGRFNEDFLGGNENVQNTLAEMNDNVEIDSSIRFELFNPFMTYLNYSNNTAMRRTSHNMVEVLKVTETNGNEAIEKAGYIDINTGELQENAGIYIDIH